VGLVRSRCTLTILTIVLPLAGRAQTHIPSATENAGPQASLEERMRKSIEQQKRSVRRQVGESDDAADSWFTVPWPRQGAPVHGPVALPPAERSAPAALKSAARPDCNPFVPSDLDGLIRTAAEREGYTSELLHAVIRHESAYHPCAVSPKGALGLMQLMPETARTLGVVDPLDPVENVNAGSKFLGQLLERYSGDLALALGAYNAGPGAVDRYGGIPPYEETKDYVRRILKDLSNREPSREVSQTAQ
jgi:hypothetical protein